MPKRNEDLRRKVYDLRAQGYSKAEIGRRLGYQRQRIHQLLCESSPFKVDLRPVGRRVLFNSESEEGK